jgi:AmmeMemoRadiSam system protein A
MKGAIFMWLWGCLTPHPPIIISKVGRGNEKEARSTIKAMEDLSEFASNKVPDVLLVLSPHASFNKGLNLLLAEEYEGSMSMFGVPEEKLKLKGNPEKGTKLANFLSSSIRVSIGSSEKALIDHGSFVPLHFLKKREGFSPSVIIANPVGLTYREAYNAGTKLRDFEDDLSWSLLASGDLSHSLKPGAPSGFHPDGQQLDKKIIQSLENNDPSGLLELSEIFVNNAAECGVRSVLFLLGLFSDRKINILSYEGPFGVGYCVAHTTKDTISSSLKDQDSFTRLARQAIRQKLEKGEEVIYSEPEEELKKPRACFVSLKSREGKLRGCIGTIYPVHSTLYEEIISNALSAALRDPRFPPVRPEELKDLLISVDVLSEPEDISDISCLDPAIYGVIVEKGNKRGVLLPDLEGVNTIQEQLNIACSKAGIRQLEGTRIFRFTVTRYSEKVDNDE